MKNASLGFMVLRAKVFIAKKFQRNVAASFGNFSHCLENCVTVITRTKSFSHCYDAFNSQAPLLFIIERTSWMSWNEKTWLLIQCNLDIVKKLVSGQYFTIRTFFTIQMFVSKDDMGCRFTPNWKIQTNLVIFMSYKLHNRWWS